MKKILVVDDQQEVREIIKDFLDLRGYDVLEAEDGQIALQLFDAHKPNLAIVDIEMPVMNGLQFSQSVLDKHPEFPIIMITAFIQKHTPKKLESIGIRKLLQKPINLLDLDEAIKEFI